MTTINWTKINFSLLELIQIVGRIELQNNIVHFELADKDISFPRVQNRSMKLHTYPLPSNEEIQRTLQEAQIAALEDASKFGMVMGVSDILHCEVRKGHIQRYLKDYSKKKSDIDDRFVQVFDDNGSTKTVLKSSLVWVLTETKGVLSNDRLRRVQGQSGIPNKRKNNTRKNIEISPRVQSKRSKQQIAIRVENEIQVGNWCFYKRYANTLESRKADEIIAYGAVLAFKYINGKTDKEKEYTLDFAPITSDVNANERGVEVLGAWYKYGQNNILEPFSDNNNFFMNIENYIATVDGPCGKRDPNTNQIFYELQNHHEIKNAITELYEKQN